MNTDKAAFEGKHREVTDSTLKAHYDVYNELGSGFLESVYHGALLAALSRAGVRVAREVSLPIYFQGHLIAAFRADLIVEGKVLVELKAVQVLDRTHLKRILKYLKATLFEVALLLDFGSEPEFKRLVMENEDKRIRVEPCESAVVFIRELCYEYAYWLWV